VGDFTGNGFQDIAVGNYVGASVTILLGNGDGTFRPGGTIGTGEWINSLAAGDFNGDGNLDLAVGMADRVGILLGNGDGSFQPMATYPVQGAISLAVADLNHDGVPDLVTATNSSANAVDVLLGRGDGTFSPAAAYPAGSFTRGVAVADFDGDGNPDIVAGNPSDNTVSLLRGNGDGTFQAPVAFPAGNRPQGITAGDFNGDGAPDLAVADAGDAGISVLLNTAAVPTNLVINAPASVPINTPFPVTVSAGDQFGGVATGYRGTVGWSTTDPNAFLPPAYTFTAADRGTHTFVASLGTPDTQYLTVTDAADPTLTATAAVFVRTANLFNPPTAYPGPAHPYAVVTADFNGDGIPDLASVSADNGDVTVLLGTGDGRFRPGGTYHTLNGAVSLAVGDFNNDGIPDLVVPALNNAAVSVLLGNGDGTFRPPILTSAGPVNPWGVAVGDFNGDGNLDVAVANYAGSGGNTVSVFLGNGDGTFRAPVSYPVGPNPQGVVVADLRGDGRLDLVVSNNNLGSGAPSTVSVLRGNGDGTFQPAVNYPVGANPGALVAGDFNGDGYQDVAVANDGSGTVSVLLGNGDGTLQPAVTYAAGIRPFALAAADFQSNGTLDLVVANGRLDANTLTVLRGNGDGTFRAPEVIASTGSQFLTGLAVGDFNGDGAPDLAVSVFTNNTVAVLLNTTLPMGGGRAASGGGTGEFGGVASFDAGALEGRGPAGGPAGLPVTSPVTAGRGPVADGTGGGTAQADPAEFLVAPSLTTADAGHRPYPDSNGDVTPDEADWAAFAARYGTTLLV
jgi:hypothetical protein